MIQASQHNLIPRSPGPGQGAAEGHRQAGHVLPKDDLVRGGCIVEVGYGLPRFLHHFVGIVAAGKGAAQVAAALLQIVADGIDNLLRCLRAAWAIQVEDRGAVYLSFQCRKMLSPKRGVKGYCTHAAHYTGRFYLAQISVIMMAVVIYSNGRVIGKYHAK